jgi:hypothetical protein
MLGGFFFTRRKFVNKYEKLKQTFSGTMAKGMVSVYFFHFDNVHFFSDITE